MDAPPSGPKPRLDNSVVLEEWRQLQSIIGRFEGQDVTTRGWLLALLAALLASVLTGKSALKPVSFVCAWVIAAIVFAVMEGSSRAIKRKALDRAGIVEQALAAPASEYIGPRIHGSLSSTETAWPKAIQDELCEVQVWLFYVAVCFVGLVIGFSLNTLP